MLDRSFTVMVNIKSSRNPRTRPGIAPAGKEGGRGVPDYREEEVNYPDLAAETP
jgi:hypothetical protein